MERVNRILQNPYYKECLRKIGDWEKDRILCGHDTNHLLHVARIAMLLNIEEKMNIPKAHVYAAALLHDIGRFVEYETGEDHAVVSARMAPEFLVAAGFGEAEVAEVVGAIGNHRNKAVAKELAPSGITVNCVAPGVIDTDMNRDLSEDDRDSLAEEIPVGRFGTAAEAASPMLFLASKEASYITAQVIGVNGGFGE